jgi:hypothetical protein
MRVYALLRPTDSAPLKENVYEAVTFSVINFVLMEWTVPLVRKFSGSVDGAIDQMIELFKAA